MSDTVTWYVTFGIGGPNAGQYSEVQVARDQSEYDQEVQARTIVVAAYGTAWAFLYRPESFDRSIGRYGMTLREVLR